MKSIHEPEQFSQSKLFPTITLADLFSELDDRIFDDHSKLIGGWSKDQLTLDIDKVWRDLFPGRTTRRLLAIARFARSVYVAECHHPGQGCHYSRAMSSYNDRYRRTNDPFDSYRLTTGAADDLQSLGLIDQVCGRRWGKETAVYPTRELMDFLAYIDPQEAPASPPVPEMLFLKSKSTIGKDGKEIPGSNLPYRDTAETKELKSKLAIILAKRLGTTINYREGSLDVSRLRMIFVESFARIGRIYEKWQNIESSQRQHFRWVMNGKEYRMVELDYRCMMPTLAYYLLGVPPPPGDLYEILGWEGKEGRKLVKLGMIVMLNGGGTRSIRREGKLFLQDAKLLVQDIKKAHPALEPLFGTDTGANLMKMDGQIAIEVMLAMIDKTGICPLQVHDSFLVPDIYEDILRGVMKEKGRPYGLIVDGGAGGEGRKEPS